ncbi:M28 family metallopeptidase [Halobacterium salinarum]|uniref:M28 family peptidase n=1 Tax=Halobacterium TaxID=2239 RepID=UPI0019627138|nr:MULTISPECIES: M28 family metallopeptidase [Halobacterium]MCF2165656.1 M28 family peptidase [Halobacterium salinarum]MCF2168932.1 M28 family peptidase [Halobacterium salinarum]MCF2238952.1 M28 family peptidase [Halobacterium salinarum]MDL0140316.1 M28 family metallopeptidase [Halobacterium salinarum]QRY23142.1 M28 family peptidase [Halobacterium sp. GSL-19]
MTDWIGDTFTSTTGWTHLQRLVDTPTRMAGSDGEREAAAATRDALAQHADDAWLDTFPVQGWTRGDSAIETPADTTADTIALPRSPAGTAAGEFVDLGYGLPADFEDADLDGAIVMVAADVPDWYDRHLHRREKYAHAVAAGAAGFVYMNHVAGCLPATGSVGTGDDPIGEIPAVGVSTETGTRLSRRFEHDTVTLTVDADTHDATSQNVHATLGPNTDAELLVTSHVDAHDITDGAMDNGAGTAMAVELARILAARESALDTRVHFVCFGAEEVGLVGSHHDAAQRDLDDVRAVLNLDGVVRERTLKLYTHRFDALGDAANAVSDTFAHPITVAPALNPHSDHWAYVKHGVPGYHATSDAAGGRGWGHTSADTLDKLELRTFREHAILLAALAARLADDGFAVAHASEADVAAGLTDAGLAEGMQITGDWPY